VKTYALFLWVGACVISSCKSQQVITTPGETVIVTERVTVVDTLELRDTIILEKERLRIEIMRLPGDSIVVEGECSSDTIRVETTKYEYHTEELEQSRGWTRILFFVALVLFILVILKFK